MIKLVLFHPFPVNNIKEWLLIFSFIHASCEKIVPWYNPTLILLLQGYSEERLRKMHLDISNVLYLEFGDHCATATMFIKPILSCKCFVYFTFYPGVTSDIYIWRHKYILRGLLLPDVKALHCRCIFSSKTSKICEVSDVTPMSLRLTTYGIR